MHHTITDGVGGVRLSALFLDLQRDAPEPVIASAEDEDQAAGEDSKSVLDHLRRPIDLTRRAAGDVLDSVRNPVETAQSFMRQVLIADRAHSPLWAGKRSLGRHFELLQVDLDRAKAAAKRLGGTVNDLYLTGVAAGAGAFHRANPSDWAAPNEHSTTRRRRLERRRDARRLPAHPTGSCSPAMAYRRVHPGRCGARFVQRLQSTHGAPNRPQWT